MISLWTFLQLVPLLVLLYFYINKKYSYWSSRGVKGPRPIFPFGYTLDKALYCPNKLEQSYLKKYGKVYGVYTGTLPTLSICDHELIKQVLVKDFHNFVNRRVLNSEHEIWNQNLFVSESEDWKRIRAITSPAFTTGKLRGMYGLMNQCVKKLTTYFDQQIGGDGIINTKEVIAGFTIDVIASTSFATETSANDDRAKTNPFVYHGLKIFNFHPLKIASILIFPRPILNALGIRHFFPSDSFKFFTDLTRNVINERKTTNVKRNDLVQLMMNTYALEEDLKGDNYDKLTASMDNDAEETNAIAENVNGKSKKKLTENEIIAQCLLFFFAGFETTAATLTHTIFELAHNPEIQERLCEEIDKVVDGVDENNLDEYFDKLLKDCHYLDAVIHETLRKYPPVVRLERRVGNDGVKLGGIPVDRGTLVEIPTVAVHHNPEYYPNPQKYDPERFMPENKHLLVPYTYLPFGQGPRNCIGMRFAYQEAKLAMAAIARGYRFHLAPCTPSELVFAKGSPMLTSSPFKVKVTRR